MQNLVYPRERVLGTLTLIMGLFVWLLLVGILYAAMKAMIVLLLLVVLFLFLGYCFVQSALIAWLRGSAIRVSAEQHPDLYQHFVACCEKLEIKTLPELYIHEADGLLNAFATRFLGRHYVLLFSAVVDALEDDPKAIRFYIGHELGHIRRRHLVGHIWRMPVLWMPLIGAAYARACEYSCDLHGRACCDSVEAATRALTVLAAGPKRWKTTNIALYAQQAADNTGFWASLHELLSGYPWLTKRVEYLQNPEGKRSGRNPLAYLVAMFMPYGGRFLGGVFGLVMLVAIIGMLGAIGIPAYSDYTKRAQLYELWLMSAPARQELITYYQTHDEEGAPTLEAAGISEKLRFGATLSLVEPETLTIRITARDGTSFAAYPIVEDGMFQWVCEAEEGVSPSWLPRECRRD